MKAAPPKDRDSSPSKKLRIYTLGRFLVLVEGKPITDGSKSRTKPLELLKVLIALGGEAVPEQKLSDILWPESDGDQAHQTFRTTLHRLRKLVGKDTLVLRDQSLSLASHTYWLDSQAFLFHQAEVSQALETSDHIGAMKALQSGLRLYQGPFLDGTYDPPEILSAREKLHSLFMRNVEAGGVLLEKSKKHNEVLDLYRKALEADDLAEPVYQGLMRVCIELDRHAEGKAAYKRFAQLLWANGGGEPESETKELYRSMVSKQVQERRAPEKHPEAGLPPAGPTQAASQPREPLPKTKAANVDGERRLATAMICGLDLLGGTRDALDPEEWEEVFRRVKAEMLRILEAHGGMVNQFVGDEVVTVFGMPTAHEDDPVRAVRAAMEMHRAVGVMKRHVERDVGLALSIRTGIDTSLMVIRPGDERDGRYGVSGKAIGSATRLAGSAGFDEILVGPETRRLVANFFQTEPAGSGKGRKTGPHRVVAETGFRSNFEAAERKGYTPFIGRDSELATLHACLAKAMAGQGQFVTVVGEAGIGKSRLLYEFRHSLDRERVTVLEGRCQSYGTVTPYLPLLDALRRGLRLREEDSPARLLEKAVANLRAIDPALERFIPHYLHLLSIPALEFPLPANLKEGALKRAFEEALAAVTILNTRHRPMVEIFEDWHWADEASESALKHMIGLIAPCPLMVVVLYRPEYEPRWGNPAHHQPIVLKSLEPGHSEEIIKHHWQASRFLPSGLCALIHRHTGGNPFFVEEIGNALREERTVVIRDGEATLTRPVETVHLPDTVQAVIQTRMDRLRGEARETLRLASVIGREFDRRLLEAIHPAPQRLPDLLEEIGALDLVQQTRVLPQPGYMFKHVLTQAVAYETLLHQQRRELNGRVAAAIERLFAERLDEHYEALAHHYGNSADAGKAIQYLQLAGDKATRLFSLVDARTHYRNAIDLMDDIEDQPERQEKRIDLALKLAAVSYYAPSEEQLRILETALEDARELGDEIRAARTNYWIGRTHFIMGDMAQALPLFKRGIEMAEHLGDEELLALAYNFIGISCLHTAEYSKAIEHLERGIPMADRLGLLDDSIYSIAILGLIYGFIGDFTKGIHYTEKALEKASSIRNLTREAHALYAIGIVQMVRGNWSEALSATTKCYEITNQVGDVILGGLALLNKGYSHFFLGDHEKGIEWMRDGIHQFGTIGSRFSSGLLYAFLSETNAVAGIREVAIDCGNKALERTQFGEKMGESWAYRALAMAVALETPPDLETVDDHLQKSMLLARERGQRPWLAVTHFRYAEILHKKGDLEAAREQLDLAEVLFAEMEMAWWSEQAEGLRGRIEVGEAFRGFAPYLDGEYIG